MKFNNIISFLIKEEVANIFESRGEFKFHIFKNIKGFKAKNKYAELYLPLLGKGTTRATYAWKAGKVLKVAYTGEIEQNEKEVEILTTPKYSSILPKLIDYDKENYAWLLVEAVKTIDKNASLLKEFQRIKSYMFMEHFSHSIYAANSFQNTLKLTVRDFNLDPVRQEPEIKITDFSELELNLLRKIYKYEPLGFEDINRIDHWGMTMDGRLVLVDPGLVELF